MNFTQSVSTCMRKYATFSGRATRSEFWWFYLFIFLVYCGVNIVNATSSLSIIVSLAFLIPTLAAGSRRLHDIGKSGWWQLVCFIPIIGLVLMIIWFASDTKEAGDKYN